MDSDSGLHSREAISAILVPVVLMVVAYVLIVWANAVVYIGPLDRAAFGWLVPIPIWSLAPAASGLLSRHLPTRTALLPILATGAALAAIATWFLYDSWTRATCDYGLNATNAEFLARVLPVGVALGAGWAGAAWASRALARQGRTFAAFAVGIAGGFGLVWLSIVVGVLSGLFLSVCNRPI